MYEVRQLASSEFPSLLNEIPEVPKKLFARGNLPDKKAKILAVVGSRRYTNYGKQVCESLIHGLRGYNICIVSGLAIGIDGIAHRAALDAGIMTLAIPGSGLSDDVLYPRRHRGLAHEILEKGGGLLSEYEPYFRATLWSFPKRNRIMAGIAHAVLVVEAGQKSGTLITSRLATEYNRDVFAVPGSIYSEASKGPHMLIRLGATPITSSEDILEAFNMEAKDPKEASLPSGLSDVELKILSSLTEPKDRDALIRELSLDVSVANIALMQMEMNGLIAEDNDIFRKL
jgi:DNA processing protein